jgi:hypothetical protein|tara:strand:+ start:259 stop:627 length:369 start_codon:yes stop_codon:yes gene_type:complete
MQRVTIKDLEAKVENLNRLTNSPSTYSTKLDDGKYRTNVGHYHLYQAYGGVELHRTVAKSFDLLNTAFQGGVTCPAWTGCVPKRQAYDLLDAFIHGIETGKQVLRFKLKISSTNIETGKGER